MCCLDKPSSSLQPVWRDHDVVQVFYFLLARTPLSDVKVGHLTSPNRLVFGSAPIPKLPTKRPRQQPPTSLAAAAPWRLPWLLRGLRPLLHQVPSQGEDPSTSNTTKRMGGDPRTPVGFRVCVGMDNNGHGTPEPEEAVAQLLSFYLPLGLCFPRSRCHVACACC